MFLIYIISIVLYIIATLIISKNLYNYEKNIKIKLILIGFITTFVVTIIICNIASLKINIDSTKISIIKNMMVLIFAPINGIIALPHIANLLNKYKEERITKEMLNKKIIVFVIVLFIIIMLETVYIRDFEAGLLIQTVK